MYYINVGPRLVNPENAHKWVGFADKCIAILFSLSVMGLLMKFCHVPGAGVTFMFTTLFYVWLSMISGYAAFVQYKMNKELHRISLCKYAMHISLSMTLFFLFFRFQMWPGHGVVGMAALFVSIVAFLYLFNVRNEENNVWRLLAVTVAIVAAVSVLMLKSSSVQRYFALREEVPEDQDTRIDRWYYYAMALYDEGAYDEASQALGKATVCYENAKRLQKLQLEGFSEHSQQVLQRADSLVKANEWTSVNRESIY